ncbi:protein phosphatase CheZ [Herminiimonas sp. CN]|uniref:protein phosphatase CheZ n=1 Tax=Herminiimonas sp. CN TaxID=1349818 RepID=UPI0004733715|nr:protein phosphatase CheZ [Herminiimonas sp. CN]
MSDSLEDLDALFEQISAQHTEIAVVVPDAPLPATEVPEATPEGTAEAEKPMYERLGGIVRILHDSIRELGQQHPFNSLNTHIGDAQDRLAYVATLTEQAANKVLNATDVGMPAQETLSNSAKEMNARWTDMFDGKLSVEEFRLLADDTRSFTSSVVEVAEGEKARLLEIMMAQDFQDLTGQLIKKVVTITQAVERELAKLLWDNAPDAIKDKPPAQKDAEVDLMQGPAIPSAAMGQGDVDSLLDDLGF